MTTRKDEAKRDRELADSFPASDPPASSGITGPRAAQPAPDHPSDERDDDKRPKGTPTHERHATETAHQWENEKKPGRPQR